MLGPGGAEEGGKSYPVESNRNLVIRQAQEHLQRLTEKAMEMVQSWLVAGKYQLLEHATFSGALGSLPQDAEKAWLDLDPSESA